MKQLLLVFILFYSCLHPLAGQKIGQVDMYTLMNELPAAKEIETELIALQENLQRNLQEKITRLQSEYQDFQWQVERGELTEVQQENKKAVLNEMETEIQHFEQEARYAIEERRAALKVPLQAKVNMAIEAVAKENGFILIVETGHTVYAEQETYDITDLVKAKLGADPAPGRKSDDPGSNIATIDPEVIKMLSLVTQPTIAILDDGSIMFTYPDGSYIREYPGGTEETYTPEKGKSIYRKSASHVQKSNIPKPLSQFLGSPTAKSTQHQQWTSYLETWIETLADGMHREISDLVNNDAAALAQYAKLEQQNCANIYEKLDYRYFFLTRLIELSNKKL